MTHENIMGHAIRSLQVPQGDLLTFTQHAGPASRLKYKLERVMDEGTKKLFHTISHKQNLHALQVETLYPAKPSL